MAQINPDQSFIRQLKGLSNELGCRFDEKTKHFVITHTRAVGLPVVIMQIRNDDGSFRHPDMRDIIFIASGDTHKTSHKERTIEMRSYMDDFIAKQHKDTLSDFRDRTKDDKLQLIRKFASMNGGKDIQPFRKIVHKSRGQVFL